MTLARVIVAASAKVGPMGTAAEYRQYAAECVTAHNAAVVPEVKVFLLEMAQRWTSMAEQAEAVERRAKNEGSGSETS
jgi:hypothetical protein